jgi:hypothetical protein
MEEPVTQPCEDEIEPPFDRTIRNGRPIGRVAAIFGQARTSAVEEVPGTTASRYNLVVESGTQAL